MKKNLRTWHGAVVAVITFECIVGAATMNWAGELISMARHDAWLSVLIAAGITAVLVGSLVLATSLFPTASPGNLLVSGLGPWLGRAASIGFVVYLLGDAARALRTTVAMLHYSVLPRTPTWVLVLLGVAVTAPLLTRGLGAVVRFQMVVFWPTLLLAIFSLAIGFRFSDWGYLLPVLGDGLAPVFFGLRGLLEPVLGLELLLVYVLHARQARVPGRTIAVAALAGALGALGLYLYNTLAILVGFGPWEASGMTWAVMEAVRRVYLTGLFFERLDLLFLIGFLVATASTLNLYGYAALTVLRESFGLPARTWHVWVLLLIVAAAAMGLRDLADVRWVRVNILEPMGAFFLLVIPLMLIVSGWRRRYRRRTHAQGSL